MNIRVDGKEVVDLRNVGEYTFRNDIQSFNLFKNLTINNISWRGLIGVLTKNYQLLSLYCLGFFIFLRLYNFLGLAFIFIISCYVPCLILFLLSYAGFLKNDGLIGCNL